MGVLSIFIDFPAEKKSVKRVTTDITCLVHVTAIQSSDQALISPRTNVMLPSPTAAFHLSHSRSPQCPQVHPHLHPRACRAQKVLFLASCSECLPLWGSECPTPLFLEPRLPVAYFLLSLLETLASQADRLALCSPPPGRWSPPWAAETKIAFF